MRIVNFFQLIVMVCIYFFLIETVSANTNNPEKTATFMTVADIHFNPFYECTESNCPLINKLQSSPAAKWKKILAQYAKRNPIYNKNTNYILFQSMLGALKKQANDNQVQFIVLLGDLLAHNYKKNYQKYTGDLSLDGIQSFVNKTMQFITSELKNSLPFIDIYTVVGNNDTYSDHYISEPEFYKNIGAIWGKSIKDGKTRLKIERKFTKGGYYALNLSKQKDLRLIVMNTTFFSKKGTGMEIEAQEELDWLRDELAAIHKHHQKAIIALHIPIGIDAYTSVIGGDTASLWTQHATQQFLYQLKCYTNEVIAIFSGHLHADFFEIITFNEKNKKILLTGTPAISPIFGNNPGFKIYRYSPNTLEIQAYSTYYYPLDAKNSEWKLAYDSNKTYQADCHSCNLLEAMDQIQPSGKLADDYKKFYMLGKNSQPITKENKWIPYYYCAIRNLGAETYNDCKLDNKTVVGLLAWNR